MLAWILLTLCPGASYAGSDLRPGFYGLREWAPVQTWEYFAVPAALAATFTIDGTVHPPPRWQGGILFDDWARNNLRLNSDAGRSNASTASDVLLFAGGLSPFLIDAGLLTGLLHRRIDLAQQMFVLDAEALTLTALLTSATKRLVGRERPSASDVNDSFFSGHASIAATAATLLCLQHLELELLGNKVADAAVCGSAATVALSAGLLRVVSDRHYASDVIAGAAVGVGSAFLVYKLKVRRAPVEQTALRVTPMLSRDFFGLSLAGGF